MDLRSTILGLLSWKTFSGYDLKRIISDSEVFYWSGNNNQIYKSLLELEREGLVSHHVQAQDNLPTKKIYTISERGSSELTKNLLAEPQLPELHKDFLIQLAWAETLSDEEIIVLLDRYKKEIEVRLLMFKAEAARPGPGPGRSKREQYLWKRISENLIATTQTELDWVQQTRQEFHDRKYLD